MALLGMLFLGMLALNVVSSIINYECGTTSEKQRKINEQNRSK